MGIMPPPIPDARCRMLVHPGHVAVPPIWSLEFSLNSSSCRVWELLARQGAMGQASEPAYLAAAVKRAQAAAPCSTPYIEAPAQHNAKVPLGALVQQLARGAEG